MNLKAGLVVVKCHNGKEVRMYVEETVTHGSFELVQVDAGLVNPLEDEHRFHKRKVNVDVYEVIHALCKTRENRATQYAGNSETGIRLRLRIANAVIALDNAVQELDEAQNELVAFAFPD
jgi:hypothetical protein